MTARRREWWVGRKRVAAVVVVGAVRLVVAMKTCLALPHPLLYHGMLWRRLDWELIN